MLVFGYKITNLTKQQTKPAPSPTSSPSPFPISIFPIPGSTSSVTRYSETLNHSLIHRSQRLNSPFHHPLLITRHFSLLLHSVHNSQRLKLLLRRPRLTAPGVPPSTIHRVSSSVVSPSREFCHQSPSIRRVRERLSLSWIFLSNTTTLTVQEHS